MKYTLLILLGLVALSVSAQYAIDWHKSAGGGSTSSGGAYQVSGTIGQHDAGRALTGGNYSLTGGFWAISAVQTPGSPLLRLFLTPTNTGRIGLARALYRLPIATHPGSWDPKLVGCDQCGESR